MKQGLMKTIAVSCLMVLQLSAQVAHAQEEAGNSSGSGTGDNVFELQRIMLEAGANSYEVLEKAFNESQGNLPEFELSPNVACDKGNCVEYGYFNYNATYTIGINNQTGRGLTEFREEPFPNTAQRQIVDDRGPLFKRNISEWHTVAGQDRYTIQFVSTGLVLSYKNGAQTEFRTYKSGILIQKLTPISSEKCLKINGQATCASGYRYYWKR